MMTWDAWTRLWSATARGVAFARRVAQAKAFARQGNAVGRMYCSLSGGKDSVAMTGLLVEAGIKPMCAHATCGLNLPESLPTSERTCELLDLELDIVEPEEDAWALLARLPPGRDVSDPCPEREELLAACSAGNLMVQYGYESDFIGLFVGLRANESRARKMNAQVRGSVYRNSIDDKWTCLPVLKWTARDVFAFLISRGLPIHPFYRGACDLGFSPEEARVDWLFGPSACNARGACYSVKKLYPDLWRQLITVRPEMTAYG